MVPPESGTILKTTLAGLPLARPELRMRFRVLVDYGVLGALPKNGNWLRADMEQHVAAYAEVLAPGGVGFLKVGGQLLRPSNRLRAALALSPSDLLTLRLRLTSGVRCTQWDFTLVRYHRHEDFLADLDAWRHVRRYMAKRLRFREEYVQLSPECPPEAAALLTKLFQESPAEAPRSNFSYTSKGTVAPLGSKHTLGRVVARRFGRIARTACHSDPPAALDGGGRSTKSAATRSRRGRRGLKSRRRRPTWGGAWRSGRRD